MRIVREPRETAFCEPEPTVVLVEMHNELPRLVEIHRIRKHGSGRTCANGHSEVNVPEEISREENDGSEGNH
jgi:hypothetical protein